MCNAKNCYHQRNLIKEQKKQKKKPMMLSDDFTPGPSDIICGRGNVFSNRMGNQYFNTVVRSGLDEYREAPNRPAKIKVVNGILSEIRLAGVRFAKWDAKKERWYELSDVNAHKKVGHAIRDTIRQLDSRSKIFPKLTGTSSSFKRQRRSRHFALPDQPQSSFDSIESIEDDCEAPKQNDYGEVHKENLPPTLYHSERITSIGPFFLSDEYPEESFDFSASSFFGDFRISNQ